MNRPRTRKVLADLWSNRVRSLLVVASITVGLFTMGIILTLQEVIQADMLAGYAEVNPANIKLETSPFPDSLVDHMAAIPGVRQAEGRRIFTLRLEASPGEWIAIEIKATSDYAQSQISQVRLVQGSWPPSHHEIAIEQYKLPETNARVGDLVRIETPGGAVREVRLAAVVADQTVGAFDGGPGFFLAPVQGYTDLETAKWLGIDLPYRYNTLYATVEPEQARDEAAIQATLARLQDEFERIGVSVISTGGRTVDNHPNRQYIDAIARVLLILGLMVLFLSGFLITNTLQAIIRQQVNQIGILKTLGARRVQVIGMYLAFILVLGCLAALIAIPTSQRVAFQRIAELVRPINVSYRGPRVVPLSIWLMGLMALLAPQGASLIPILQGSRISVREALSGGQVSGEVHHGRLDRWITGLRLFSRPMLISLRNTFRRKGRLALTLLTLSLGGSIFIATFNVQKSMDGYVEMIGRYFLADVNLTLAQPQRTDEMQALLSGVPGVGMVEAWGAARAQLLIDGDPGAEVRLLAPPADSPLVNPKLEDGRWIQLADGNAIVLNERFARDFPEIRVGDPIRLQVNGREVEWTVVGFFQLAGRNSGYYAYTRDQSLARVTGTQGQANSYRVMASDPDLTPGEQEALALRLEQELRAHKIRIADLTTGNYLAGSAAGGFEVLTNFLLFIASLTALVGSIGLAGTMSLNVMERTREIGVLRAIGATDRILMRLVLAEGLLIGLMSWALSLPLSIPISRLLSDQISRVIFGNVSDLRLSITGYLLWFGIVLVLSALAGLIPARSAARLTIREVLAYE